MTEGVAQMDRRALSALSATFKPTAGPATREGGWGIWSFGEIQVAILSQRSWAQELTGSSLWLLPSMRRSQGESREVENALHPSSRSTTIFFFFFFHISRVLFAKEQNIVQTDPPVSHQPFTRNYLLPRTGLNPRQFLASLPTTQLTELHTALKGAPGIERVERE